MPLDTAIVNPATGQDEYSPLAELLSNVDGFFCANSVEALQAVKALSDVSASQYATDHKRYYA